MPCVACSLPSPVATQFYAFKFITFRQAPPFTTNASGNFSEIVGISCSCCELAFLGRPGELHPGTSWGVLGSPGASWGLLGFPGASWGFLGIPGISWGFLGPSGASWRFLVNPGASWGFLGLSGASLRYHASFDAPCAHIYEQIDGFSVFRACANAV